MDNPFESATPEQKLSILTNELRIPIEIIHDFAEVIRINIKSNRLEPTEILNKVDTITEAADKIKNLLDETVRSKGFYTPSKNLSSTDILLDLRQRLLVAREQNDINSLANLAIVLDMLGDVAAKKIEQGLIFSVLENLECSVRDSIQGVPWKSTIPSEEEIISALYHK